MTIGEAAAQIGVRPDTLRYYERTGLLPVPTKDAGGRRAYAGDIVRRVRFIKQAQQAGFRLTEIRDLLALRATKGRCCGDVRLRTLAKRQELGQKLRALEVIVSALDAVIEACDDTRREIGECPILHALDQGLADTGSSGSS